MTNKHYEHFEPEEEKPADDTESLRLIRDEDFIEQYQPWLQEDLKPSGDIEDK